MAVTALASSHAEISGAHRFLNNDGGGPLHARLREISNMIRALLERFEHDSTTVESTIQEAINDARRSFWRIFVDWIWGIKTFRESLTLLHRHSIWGPPSLLSKRDANELEASFIELRGQISLTSESVTQLLRQFLDAEVAWERELRSTELSTTRPAPSRAAAHATLETYSDVCYAAEQMRLLRLVWVVMADHKICRQFLLADPRPVPRLSTSLPRSYSPSH